MVPLQEEDARDADHDRAGQVEASERGEARLRAEVFLHPREHGRGGRAEHEAAAEHHARGGRVVPRLDHVEERQKGEYHEIGENGGDVTGDQGASEARELEDGEEGTVVVTGGITEGYGE